MFENVQDFGPLFVEKYLSLKKQLFFNTKWSSLATLCAVRWSGKAETEVSILFLCPHAPPTTYGRWWGIVVDIF